MLNNAPPQTFPFTQFKLSTVKQHQTVSAIQVHTNIPLQ